MKEHKNMAASVKQRLLNLSRQRGEEFNLLLVRYGIERLLYRLEQSEHASEFILKSVFNIGFVGADALALRSESS